LVFIATHVPISSKTVHFIVLKVTLIHVAIREHQCSYDNDDDDDDEDDDDDDNDDDVERRTFS
jgi:hypothetical protein